MKILLRNLTKRFPDRNKKTRGEITAVNDLTLEIPVHPAVERAPR